MNKGIALILALCLMLTLASAQMVTAADNPTLLFELDYSGTEGEEIADTDIDATVATKGFLEEGQALSASPAGTSSTKRPVYHTEASKNNTGQLEYMTFGDTFPDFPRISVPMSKDLGLANAEALTVETWIRPNLNPNSWEGVYLFTIGGNTAATRAVEALWHSRQDDRGVGINPDVQKQGNSYFISHGQATNLNSDDGSKNSYMLGYNNQWIHLVMTREWIAAAESAPFGAGTWRTSLYVNGLKRSTIDTEVEERYNYAVTDSTGWNYLVIGGSQYSSQSWKGDLASFKMYDGVFSDEEVFAKYGQEGGKYRDMAEASLTKTLVEPDEESISFTFTKPVKANTVKAENISIVDSNGEETELGAVTFENGIVTINLLEFLGYGEEYTLLFNGIKEETGEGAASVGGTFKTKAPFGEATTTFTSGGSAVESFETADKVEVSMPVVGEAEDEFAMAVLVCDQNGRGVSNGFNINKVTGSGTLNVSTTGITLAEGYTVEIVAWKIASDEKGAVAISRIITFGQ